ncbi:hypothetical protein NP233_g12251 [Leucocoprinus birnbaumii]|uniref:Nephrocystin 3-like N-terminal domain-containing protein n=1 Tax=Leucocoprinus birnbaumii TaxID=56174 RepID=A0AAD5YN82_9AGAR|nr:hypothetical protein NP233_g12251 [Leucocoprinus birnbaumii]
MSGSGHPFSVASSHLSSSLGGTSAPPVPPQPKPSTRLAPPIPSRSVISRSSTPLQHHIPEPAQIHKSNDAESHQSGSCEPILSIPSIPTRTEPQQDIGLHRHNPILMPIGSPHSINPGSPSPFQPGPQPSYTALTPQEYRMFNQGHDMIIKDAQFINHAQFHQVAPIGPGLKKLLKHSMPDAFHDSAVRYPPPKCHLGTRKEYIQEITNWALGESEHKEPVLWMRGPFGIGKSAVAQSSAEALKPINKLLATLFFSHSNSDRDDPYRVIPSIVYQITTLFTSDTV